MPLLRRLSLALSCAVTCLASVPVVAAPEPLLKLTPQQRAAAGVSIEVVGAAPVASVAGAHGQLLPGKVVVPNDRRDALLAGTAGRIEALLVNPGERVKAGQAVLRLYSGEVLSLQRAYLAASGASGLAQKKLTRDEALFADGIIAESRLQDSRDQALQAAAAVQEQRQLLQLAGMSRAAIDALRSATDLSARITVHAPRAGLVLEQPAPVGSAVDSGMPLMQLAATDQYWVELQASREQVAGITPGDGAEVTTCGVRGKVIAAGGRLDDASQTALVRAQFPGTGQCLTPGQFVQVLLLPTAAPAGALRISAEALVQSGGKDYVFVEEAAGLRPVAVKVLRRDGDTVLLGGGVTAGTRIAGKGIAALKGSWMGLGSAASGNE